MVNICRFMSYILLPICGIGIYSLLWKVPVPFSFLLLLKRRPVFNSSLLFYSKKPKFHEEFFCGVFKALLISPDKARLHTTALWFNDRPAILCQSSSASHLIGWAWQMVARYILILKCWLVQTPQQAPPRADCLEWSDGPMETQDGNPDRKPGHVSEYNFPQNSLLVSTKHLPVFANVLILSYCTCYIYCLSSFM